MQKIIIENLKNACPDEPDDLRKPLKIENDFGMDDEDSEEKKDDQDLSKPEFCPVKLNKENTRPPCVVGILITTQAKQQLSLWWPIMKRWL